MACLQSLSSYSMLTVEIPPAHITFEDEAPAKNKRCGHTACKKRLSLLDFDCKCGLRFCGAHRMPEEHRCTFDFKHSASTTLSRQLVKCTAAKLEKI